jgi:hypothetical protein
VVVRLAGESARKYAIASKPAPTGKALELFGHIPIAAHCHTEFILEFLP